MTTLNRLRNVGISAHIDSGKTTLTERMLFYSGRIHTIRDVRGNDGGATMDSDPIERRRGITIASAATRVEWDEHQINIIDTPGHVDFTVEVERSLRVLDGAVLVLCSVGGVQSQSLTIDRQMRRYGVPRIAFINKMDRMGANPDRVISQLRERLNANPVALQLPIGVEGEFVGVVDLVDRQAVFFEGLHGEVIHRDVIPNDLLERAESARKEMLETLALFDETLLESIAGGENPASDQIRDVIRQATIARQITPVLMGSAFKNKGVQEVLSAITRYLPSPEERDVFAIDGRDGRDQIQQCDRPQPASVRLNSDPKAPLVAMAFKTVIEKFGQLTYLRVYQGTIRKGESYRCARTGKRVRFGRLVRMHADQLEDIDMATAGDIIGVVGIDCASGDTFTSSECRLSLENIHVADPVMQLAIAPEQRKDADRLAKALDRFRREDPTFQVSTDSETGETLIAGMGQLHLDVYIERIESDYGCRCVVGHPRVAYKERPTKSVSFEHRLKKMTGGPGMFAQITGRLELLPDDMDEGFAFEDQITGGRIQARHINAVQDGFVQALQKGPIGHFEVVGAKLILVDGMEHKNDSSEMAFKLCARSAMRDVILPKAEVVLLEPVMRLSVEMPVEFQGSITGQLARKRGVVTSTDITSDGLCQIVAEVPLSELFDYSNELRSVTQGKGAFTMQPLTYRIAPAEVQAAVHASSRETVA